MDICTENSSAVENVAGYIECVIPIKKLDMGHANVSITLDTYTHVGFQDAEMEMRRVAGGGYTT